mgnify:CR=1 FL=1
MYEVIATESMIVATYEEIGRTNAFVEEYLAICYRDCDFVDGLEARRSTLLYIQGVLTSLG